MRVEMNFMHNTLLLLNYMVLNVTKMARFEGLVFIAYSQMNGYFLPQPSYTAADHCQACKHDDTNLQI